MLADQSHAQPRQRRSVVALKLAVSVAMLAFLFTRVDLRLLWAGARQASAFWLTIDLALYFASIIVSTLRWRVLLDAQNVHLSRRSLLSSYLVAGFFNNFLPSNIGGDVVRIRDTAGPAGSTTVATAVVLMDRGIGLMGLVLVAAVGASVAGAQMSQRAVPLWASWLWAGFGVGVAVAAPAVLAPSGFGRLLRPLAAVHPEWIGKRIETVTGVLGRFRERLWALGACFVGALAVQALLVLYYAGVARALRLPVGVWVLAVIVPLSFLVQMLPVSINGFGVREATFSFYLTRLGLPLESALLLSLTATALMMLFSLTGAAVYVSRPDRKRRAGGPSTRARIDRTAG